MKLRILLCFVILGVISICNGDFRNVNEQKKAKEFAQVASSQLYAFYEKLSKDIFELGDVSPYTTINDFETVLKTAKELSSVAKAAMQFNTNDFDDEELKYIFDILRKSAGDAILDEQSYKKMLKSMALLEDMASDKDIPIYRHMNRNLAYYPDVEEIFSKSNDPEELKYYWTVWRERNGAWTSGLFIRFLETMKEAAAKMQTSNLEYWMKGYNVTEMEIAMNKIRPMYLQLHGFVRKQLHIKYGSLVIDPNGPIPDHLFHQVIAQAWTKGSIIEDMFPHTDLPSYDAILKNDTYYNTARLYDFAEDFFLSIGFEKIPNAIWESRIKMNPNGDKGDCRAVIFDKSPSFYLRYCQKMDFRKFLQAHGYMARVFYAIEKRSLPAYYFNSYDLEYPMGEAVILSATTSDHVQANGLVTDFDFTEDVEMNRLFRMAIHTLLTIPVYFVHTKMMYDLFSGKVDKIELNRHYWELMEHYAGVGPPSDRSANIYDFSYKFYVDLNENQQARKFQTEVLGYQFYRKLCMVSGEYPRKPLHKCDFFQKPEAGAALKKMMRLGSSKPFREVMSKMFPEDPSVSADSLLEYYKPIKSRLIRKNREDRVIVGWKHHDKTISSVVYYMDQDLESRT